MDRQKDRILRVRILTVTAPWWKFTTWPTNALNKVPHHHMIHGGRKLPVSLPLRSEHIIPPKEAQKMIFQIFRLGLGLFSESIPTSVQKCYGWKVMPSASESFKYPTFNVSGATITCCVSRTLELLTLSEYIPFQAPQLAGCTRVPCYKICATQKSERKMVGLARIPVLGPILFQWSTNHRFLFLNSPAYSI